MATYLLSPVFQDAQLNNSGRPASGYKVRFTLSGTSTPVATYKDRLGVAQHTYPIVLNARGEPPSPIWVPAGTALDATLLTAADVVVRTISGLYGIEPDPSVFPGSGGDVELSSWAQVTSYTYVSATSIKVPGDHSSESGAYPVGRRVRYQLSSGNHYGTILSKVYNAGETTINISYDQTPLDSSLSSVWVGSTRPASSNISTLHLRGISSTNAVFNSDFSLKQRSASSSGNGYLVDRWFSFCVSPASITLKARNSLLLSDAQYFVGGAAGIPQYYYRHQFSAGGSPTPSSFVKFVQNMYGLRQYSGQRFCISFFARSDAGQKIGVGIELDFGDGGSPTVNIQGIPVTTTTSWARYYATFTVPDLTGKVLGTGENLKLTFWLDAGSDIDYRSGGIGHQSGTIDLACVKLEPGDVPTIYRFLRVADELKHCQRFYQKSEPVDLWLTGEAVEVFPQAIYGNDYYIGMFGFYKYASPDSVERHAPLIQFKSEMFTTPSVYLYSLNGIQDRITVYGKKGSEVVNTTQVVSASAVNINTTGFYIRNTSSDSYWNANNYQNGMPARFYWHADAEVTRI